VKAFLKSSPGGGGGPCGAWWRGFTLPPRFRDVERPSPPRLAWEAASTPSTTLRAVPLPLRGRIRRVFLALFAVLSLAAASDPADRLPDPSQEARARHLFAEIRCLVCQNESIDDSEADLAHDLRQIVREQVKAGRSDGEIRDFLVARYGQFVLLKPPFDPGNLALWLGPFAILLIGGGLLAARLRRPPNVDPLSEDEERRLAVLLDAAPDDTFAPERRPKEKPDDDGKVT
jgi:cytochrome c-type biogenesis protein CcmH